MMKLLYLVLAAPFIAVAKLAEFICWGIVSPVGNKRIRVSNLLTPNDAGTYIQVLLKENAEGKKRADELHDYYKRQLKKQAEQNRRRDRQR